ncbi:MAG: hypothetical protein O7J95_21390, partial [Planctomycetota bacterium]|nr:hypothetical protein [Planctomycetota bacterium]
MKRYRSYRKSNVKARDKERSQDVGHLDETIADIASSASSALQRHWKAIALVIAATSVVVFGYFIVDNIAEGREEDLHARLYELTKSSSSGIFFSLPGSGSDDAPDIEGLEALLVDARGSRGETYIVRSVGQHLMETAQNFDRKIRRAQDLAGSSDGGGAGDPTDSDPTDSDPTDSDPTDSDPT